MFGRISDVFGYFRTDFGRFRLDFGRFRSFSDLFGSFVPLQKNAQNIFAIVDVLAFSYRPSGRPPRRAAAVDAVAAAAAAAAAQRPRRGDRGRVDVVSFLSKVLFVKCTARRRYFGTTSSRP